MNTLFMNLKFLSSFKKVAESQEFSNRGLALLFATKDAYECLKIIVHFFCSAECTNKFLKLRNFYI